MGSDTDEKISMNSKGKIVITAVSNLFMMISIAFAAAAFGSAFKFYTVATILTLLRFGILTGMRAPDVNANRPNNLSLLCKLVNAYIVQGCILAEVKADARLSKPSEGVGIKLAIKQTTFRDNVSDNCIL